MASAAIFRFDVKENIDDVIKNLSQIERLVLPKAARRAVNETAKRAKVQASRQIAKQTSIKVSDVKKAIKVLPARETIGGGGEYEIVAIVYPLSPRESGGRQTNLIAFVSKGRRTTRAFKKKSGVTAKAWGRTKLYKGAFIGRGKTSGKLLVFKRTGPTRDSGIEAIPGPSIPKTFITDGVVAAVKAKVKEDLPKILRSKIEFEISKL